MFHTRHFFFAFLVLALLLTAKQRGQAQQIEDGKVLDKTKSEWLTILEKNEKARMRRAAVLALGIFGPGEKDILPALNKALAADKDESVRLQIVAVLGSLKPEVLRDALPTLADTIKDDKSAAVRAATANLIAKLGALAKPALVPLTGALKDADSVVRAEAVKALGVIGAEAKTAANDMLPLLKDSDSFVRQSAVFAFGRWGREALPVVPNLLQLLENDSAAEVRLEVARTLAAVGPDADTLPAVAKALRNDKSEEVRRQLALTLEKMGNLRSIVKELFDVLHSDKDRVVRVHLVHSISKGLGSSMKDYVKDFAVWLNKDPDADVRLEITQELGALGPAGEEAVDALMIAESDVVLQVREAARQAIVRIKEKPKKEPAKEPAKK
jgi:HEAT repeat protein